MMSRRQFIESQGAPCANWTWSWSFINEAERTIILGAWDTVNEGGKALILSEDWQVSKKGRKLPGYAQSREHLRLVEEQGYVLKTFPMKEGFADEDDDKSASKIADFTPTLSGRRQLKLSAMSLTDEP